MRRFLLVLIILAAGIWLIIVSGKRINQRTESPVRRTEAVRQYDETFYRSRMDSLKARFGSNKQLPEGFELQTLLALSHYPELTDVYIAFHLEEAWFPLASRPEPLSLLHDKPEWRYNVIISTQTTDDMEPMLLKNLPFNAQIGILGHELAHTAFYLDKNIWEMLIIGLNYPLPSFRSAFEKNTDRRTIAHGLGWQLLDFATYVRQQIDYENTAFGEAYYLNPKQIRELSRKHDSVDKPN